ncbi:uncharacterized protein K489DRAFT_289586, partial [Dissoconium aciculare CBS 342.82]|uniref:F-box domain-containing protein n=1 Tax=Dissoconium aciculare CBS 342.82 TaxID=1314786 RepID=A0A6J3M3H5_9PEZI
LPPELLLEVIPRVPYSPSNLSALRRTSPELKSLIHRHETSIVRAINELQHHCSPSQAHQSHHLFPSLQLHNFASLDVLHGRLVRLEDLHAQWLHITSHGPELAWLRGRWETIHKAGLLLLYRLQDTLPAPALACLLFKLVSSIKILRVHGAAPIHGTYAAGDVLTRSDVELAAEEMLLLHGPEWFLGMMRAGRGGRKGKNGEGEEERSGRRGKEEDDGQWAVDLLTSELTNFTTRQSPDPTTHLPRPPTLTSRLRRAFSNQTGNSPLVENLGRMWEMLAAPVWDRVDEEMLGRVVGGVGLLG